MLPCYPLPYIYLFFFFYISNVRTYTYVRTYNTLNIEENKIYLARAREHGNAKNAN